MARANLVNLFPEGSGIQSENCRWGREEVGVSRKGAWGQPQKLHRREEIGLSV